MVDLQWPQLVLTPKASPARALAAAVGLGPEAGRRMAEGWRSDPQRCLEDLRAMSAAGAGAAVGEQLPGGLVVVVDQFEHIFAAGVDEAERAWFIEVLDRLSRAAGEAPAAPVILGVRADFYAACMAYPQLRTAMQAGVVWLDPLNESELKQIIRLPAQDVGLDVEDGLVEALLADLEAVGNAAGTGPDGASYAGQLPLLAHVLRATWQQHTGNTLTVDGYRYTGGVQRAIATTADRLFDALPQQYRDVARRVFIRLVVASGTGRRVAYDDLLRDAADPEQAATVVDDFTRSRLLTRDLDTVAITHESLISEWPRLRGWIEQDQADSLMRQHLEQAAVGWVQAGREPGVLYSGSRLKMALAWAETYESDLSATAGTFLAAARRHQRKQVLRWLSPGSWRWLRSFRRR